MSIIKPGIKHDQKKLRWGLLPIEIIKEVVIILTFGAEKYGPNNWKLLPDGEERYYEAFMRHFTDYRLGEYYDKETGRPHLAHALCNLIFLFYFWAKRVKYIQKKGEKK